MWLVFALCGLTLGQFIELQQQKFIGEDKKLAQHLKTRMQSPYMPPPPPTDYAQNSFMFAVDLQEVPQQPSKLNETRRSVHNYKFVNTPDPIELKMRTFDMMRHHIYLTQYRLKDLQSIASAYSGSLYFRLSYTFSQLDTLVGDMAVILARMNRTLNQYDERGYRNREEKSFFDHLVHYTYLLKKNVDITYLVEHSLELHKKGIEEYNKMMSEVKAVSDRVEKSSLPPSEEQEHPTEGENRK